MLNGKTDVGIGKEIPNVGEPQNEFSYAGLSEEMENSQSATGLDWEGGFVVPSPRTALACMGEISAALSGSSTKSKLIALGNPTHAVLDHQHRTPQQLFLFLKY